jgi:hypothetical protein
MRDIVNLDQKAAQFAQKIVNDGKDAKLENQVTKALGVLQEQGVYALLLFIFSENDKAAKAIYNNFITLLNEIGLKDKDGKELYLDNKNSKDKNFFQYVLKFFSDNILNNLDHLFLVRDIYEQTLTYARYGAKALDKFK